MPSNYTQIFSSDHHFFLIHGKGGVGKSTLSKAISTVFARKYHKKTLWVTIEDPQYPPHTQALEENLTFLNVQFAPSLQEYVALKLKSNTLASLFVHNKLIYKFAKIAPGIRDIVLLGKIWFELNKYEKIIVDMPATGHGLALLQSLKNFIELFAVGPLYNDAWSMKQTIEDPHKTLHLITSIPEQMALQEAKDCENYLISFSLRLKKLYILNKMLLNQPNFQVLPETQNIPFTFYAEDFAAKKLHSQKENIHTFMNNIEFLEVPFFAEKTSQQILNHVVSYFLQANL